MAAGEALALSFSSKMSSDQKTVLVTGAGGKTGLLALKKLMDCEFQARAFVHSTAVRQVYTHNL